MSLAQLHAVPDLVDQVYGSLLAAISRGDFAPGHRLTQEELAEKLAVSRQPVLQALRLLKKEGFVVDAPVKSGAAGGARGLMVAPLDGAMIARLYQVRSVLDGLAARLAAGGRAVIVPALMQRGRDAAAAGDVGALIDADAEFHACIYAASGNPLIAESAGRHWHHIRRAMGAVLQSTGARGAIWDEHEAIALAVAAGDAHTAERLAREHCEAAGVNLARSLDRHQALAS
jgi:DNA-binding GntR family transcriptional regulator